MASKQVVLFDRLIGSRILMNHEDCHLIFHRKRDLRCKGYKRSKFRVSVSLEVITLALPIVMMFTFEPRNGVQ